MASSKPLTSAAATCGAEAEPFPSRATSVHQVEELTLDAIQERLNVVGQLGRPRQADGGVQFVNVAKDLGHGGVLGNAAAAGQAGLAAVAGFCVDLHP